MVDRQSGTSGESKTLGLHPRTNGVKDEQRETEKSSRFSFFVQVGLRKIETTLEFSIDDVEKKRKSMKFIPISLNVQSK